MHTNPSEQGFVPAGSHELQWFMGKGYNWDEELMISVIDHSALRHGFLLLVLLHQVLMLILPDYSDLVMGQYGIFVFVYMTILHLLKLMVVGIQAM